MSCAACLASCFEPSAPFRAGEVTQAAAWLEASCLVMVGVVADSASGSLAEGGVAVVVDAVGVDAVCGAWLMSLRAVVVVVPSSCSREYRWPR